MLYIYIYTEYFLQPVRFAFQGPSETVYTDFVMFFFIMIGMNELSIERQLLFDTFRLSNFGMSFVGSKHLL